MTVRSDLPSRLYVTCCDETDRPDGGSVRGGGSCTAASAPATEGAGDGVDATRWAGAGARAVAEQPAVSATESTAAASRRGRMAPTVRGPIRNDRFRGGLFPATFRGMTVVFRALTAVCAVAGIVALMLWSHGDW